MKSRWTKRILLSLIALVVFLGAASHIRAQSCDSSCSPSDPNYGNCLKAIEKDCLEKVTSLQGQANTLSNQIAQFNAQIQLTTLKILQTQEQIKLLGGRIDQLETSLGSLSDAFSGRAVQTYKMARSNEPVFLLLNSKNLNDVISSFYYLAKIEQADQNLMVRLQKAQNNYKDQKTQQEDLSKQLSDQQQILNTQKAAKARLLAETQGSEARYRELLTLARAELAHLSQYAESVGISPIPHQDLSDSWGKFYVQADANWWNILINGQGTGCGKNNDLPCTLALVGCLATSYAMVVTHFGGTLTPANVAVNPSNFSVGTADFNNPGPSANGHSPTRLDNPSIQQLRDALSSPQSVVIAGLSMNGGPFCYTGSNCHFSDHWVVLRSIDGDSFRINDPVFANGMNVSLKDHYSGWTIIQAIAYN